MRLPRTYRRAAYAALVCASAAVALLLVGRGPDRRTVTAEFTDVRGLVTGAEVRLAGVNVGEVTRIWLGRDGWPRVQMSVDRDVSPARAAVRLASLSGEFNRYVSVTQGPPTSFIPLSRTTSPVEVDEALSTFDPATEAALKSMLGGLRRTLAGQGPALAATLRESQAALDQVAGVAGDIGDDGGALQLAVHSTHVIATTLATRAPKLASAVENGAALMHTLAANAGTVAAAVTHAAAGPRCNQRHARTSARDDRAGQPHVARRRPHARPSLASRPPKPRPPPSLSPPFSRPPARC